MWIYGGNFYTEFAEEKILNDNYYSKYSEMLSHLRLFSSWESLFVYIKNENKNKKCAEFYTLLLQSFP